MAFGADDERIALVVETQANLDGLRKVTQGVTQLETTTKKAGSASGEAGKNFDTLRTKATNVKEGARAVTSLAYAAEQSALGGKSAALAFGNMAEQLANVSKNAKLVQSATIIGALVAVGVAAYSVSRSLYDSAKAAEAFRSAGSESFDQVRRQMHALQQERERLDATIKGSGVSLNPFAADQVRLRDIDRQLAGIGARYTAMGGDARTALERQQQELRRNLGLQAAIADSENISLQLKLKNFDASTLELRQIDERLMQRRAEVAQQFLLRDSQGDLRALTSEELALRDRLIAAAERNAQLSREDVDRQARIVQLTQAAELASLRNPGSVVDQYSAQKARIVAEEQANAAIVNSHAIAEAKKRQLIRDTWAQASRNAQEFTSILVASGSRQVKAVGHAADAIRKILIGADAAHSAVLALKEGAAAIGSAAIGDFRGAALHGASSLQYAAAAAKGGQEALGGGGGSGGGGGGGGASAPAPYQPGNAQGGGVAVINLYTTGIYGREATQQLLYNLRRSDVLKDGVMIPPAAGLVSGMPGRMVA